MSLCLYRPAYFEPIGSISHDLATIDPCKAFDRLARILRQSKNYAIRAFTVTQKCRAKALLLMGSWFNVFSNYSSTQMGSESVAHEAEWAIDSESMRARGIIVLVKSY